MRNRYVKIFRTRIHSFFIHHNRAQTMQIIEWKIKCNMFRFGFRIVATYRMQFSMQMLRCGMDGIYIFRAVNMRI